MKSHQALAGHREATWCHIWLAVIPPSLAVGGSPFRETLRKPHRSSKRLEWLTLKHYAGFHISLLSVSAVLPAPAKFCARNYPTAQGRNSVHYMG